jgi:hypothetical protein
MGMPGNSRCPGSAFRPGLRRIKAERDSLNYPGCLIKEREVTKEQNIFTGFRGDQRPAAA